MTTLACVLDPDGRTVQLTADAWAHVLVTHAEIEPYRDHVLEAVAKPDHRELDPRPGRERFWALGLGPSRWLRVVVDFSEAPAQVVTAFGNRKDPPGWAA
ncbi:DUF4258 domain-containing protein [Conexibacter sp. DBS9H8]|uniref:DUF4258 domain-containing protein n=1 Tax=Conexibacter sp. DBS9H8 TaxID=2937801 RepID=UPI00200CE76F|nr:DUF4258 domain-containing protein [Conexibacter sp. DBS9H8]